MKGPTPEAEAKIKSNPKSKRIATMGISHQSLRCHRNRNNSPTTPKLDDILRMKFFIVTFLSVLLDVNPLRINYRNEPEKTLFPDDKIIQIQRIKIALS